MQDRLLRSRTDRVCGGVCGGLAQYFDLDPVIVRLIFVLLTIGGGFGVLIYVALWVLIPSDKALPPGQKNTPYVAPSSALPHEQQESPWVGNARVPPYDPAAFRYDPYTGTPLSHARVGEVAQPERAPAMGQTIDLRRESSAQPTAAEELEDPSRVQAPSPQAQVQAQRARHRRAPNGRLRLGGLLLAIGVVFLASELGIAEFFFPALLIIGGFLLLTRR